MKPSNETIKSRGRTIPFYERLKALYSVGYPLGTIAPILQKEFDNIEVKSITEREIQGIYLNNKEDFDLAREKFAATVQAQTMKSLLSNFVKGRDSETVILESFTSKITELAEQLADADPLDSEGGFFKIVGAIEKLHSTIRMIAGTSAVREFELFKQKEEVKTRNAILVARAENDKLGNDLGLPQASGSTPAKLDGDKPDWS